ncbi:MAG TPA: protein kinase [Steroidobacter sp.]
MSASIDKDPAEEGEDARSVLAAWLEDYAAGRCDRADMVESFLSVCRSNPDAPWDALALLDQYQRRRKIDMELMRSLKAEIAQLVFGVPNQTDTVRESPQSEADTAEVDNTGSRWRKLMAEREAESMNAEPPFADPTLFRRDREPVTRPPPDVQWRDEPVTRPPPDVHWRDEPVTRPPPRVHWHDEPVSTSPRSGSSDVLRDRYELLSILGRGSNGTVYKALDRHRAHLPPEARCVAVKVLRLTGHDRARELADLERAFHLAQSLSHPNIATVFDLDRDGDTYFIVMELLEGELLSDILRRLDGRPMLREHALGIIGSIGAALRYAHQRGVVHADLKPRSVMITSAGEVRVLDFGFGRNRAFEMHGDASLHHVSIPAPAYASVERVSGSEPHPSDDVYSLACIAYELLSGSHPFGGRSAVLARAHGRRPRSVPGLTRKQSQALNRALLWTRGERKIDVDELLTALGCADTPTRMVPPDLLGIPDVRGFWRKRVVGMGLFVALAVAAAAYLYMHPNSWPFVAQVPPLNLPTARDFPWALHRDRSSEPLFPSRVAGDSRPFEREAATSPALTAPEPESAGAAQSQELDDRSAAAGSDTTDEAASDQTVAAAPASPERTAASREPPVRAREDTVEEVQAPRAAPAAPAGPVRLQLDKDQFVATESDGFARIVVRRQGPTNRSVSFRWFLTSNSAEQGSDFANIGPGEETIPAGAREGTILVPLVSDAEVENTEVFLVEIEPVGEGVQLGERAHAAVIIVDDD